MRTVTYGAACSLDGFIARLDHSVDWLRPPSRAVPVYEKAGHALHWERPERVAADLVAFVGAGKLICSARVP